MLKKKNLAKLKKISLFTIFMLFLITTAFPQVRFGVTGGLNLNNISQEYNDFSESETEMKLGYHAGFLGEYYFTEMFSLQSGLMFNTKGYQIDIEEEYEDGEGYSRYRLSYLEVPFNLTVNTGIFKLFAGPYLAFGIDGVNNYDYTYLQINTGSGDIEVSDDGSNDVHFEREITEDQRDDDDVYVYPYDVGLNIGLGIESGPILLKAQYSLGLVNMLPELEGDSEFRDDNRMTLNGISLSVAFMFGDDE